MENNGAELSARELSPPLGSQPLECAILLGAPSADQARSSALQTQPQTWPHRKYIQTKGQALLLGVLVTRKRKGQFASLVSFRGNELSSQTPKRWMEAFPRVWGNTAGDHLCRHEWSHGGNHHHHLTLRVSWPISPTWVWTPETSRKALAFL